MMQSTNVQPKQTALTESFSNDETLKLLGFDYQKLFALEKCLDARANEHIWVECKGDVADYDSTTEVKHHNGKHSLTNNSEDAWKTIKNYVENFSVAKTFSKLILHTTSSVPEDSIFHGWNELSATEKKKKLLTHIPSATIQEHFNKIEMFEATNLKLILDRFTIHSDQPKLAEKWKELTGHPSLAMIPEEFRDDALKTLYGAVTKTAIDDSKNWKININDFQRDMRHSLSRFTTDKIPFSFVSVSDVESNVTGQEFIFIQKMEDVKLPKKTQELAVWDYLRAQSTQIKLLSLAPTRKSNLEEYDEDVQRLLVDEKLNFSNRLVAKNIGTGGADSVSRDLYSSSIGKPHHDIVNVSNTRKYYRDGRIHHVVEETDFEWKFRESDI